MPEPAPATRQHIDRAALTAELLTIVTAIWFDIDHGSGDGVSAFFTQDAELHFGPRRFRGTAEIDAVYAARAARGPRVSRHLVTNMHLTAAGPTHATTLSNLLLFAEDGQPPRTTVTPAVVSDVVDEFELRHGTWLIRSRHIGALFAPLGLDLAIPSQTPPSTSLSS